MPHNIPNLVEKIRSNDKDWLEYACATRYEMTAQQYTEQKLQALGYNVIDTGLNPKNDGHPTVIALIESREDESKMHNLIRTWMQPSYTDTMGNPTAWDTNAEVYTMKHIDYKITLLRPNGKK